MEQFKKVQVVMLPTKEKTNALKGYSDKSLLFRYSKEYYTIEAEKEFVSYFHLYFLSDDKIEEGDYVYQHNFEKTNNQVIKIETESQAKIANSKNGSFSKYKVITTTDDTLRINSTIRSINESDYSKMLYILPKPSQQFIEKYVEAYNAGNKIDEVLVEYECINKDYFHHKVCGKGNQGLCVCYLQLKVNPKDNTITIKSLKESWNREEVIELIKDAVAESHDWSRDNNDIHSISIIEKRFLNNWIKEKL